MKILGTILIAFGFNTIQAIVENEWSNGIFYGKSVNEITYTSFEYGGVYNAVTNMDSTTCQCLSEPKHYSGKLAPLNEPMAVVMRGPIMLKQFAFYTFEGKDQNTTNIDEVPSAIIPGITSSSHHIHHGHRTVTQTVIVTVTCTMYVDLYGNFLAMETETSMPSQSLQPAQLLQPVQPLIPVQPSIPIQTGGLSQYYHQNFAQDLGVTAPIPMPEVEVGDISSTKSWVRRAYYNANAGYSDGLVFLNHMGGTNGSGVWDKCFGSSLSYCSSNGREGAPESTVLGDVLIPSSHEVIIMLNELCGPECGFTRPGGIAHHGFGGEDRLFLMEFSMPHDTGYERLLNLDMPAIWLLNAQIVRTLQYGLPECSCWKSGCGEIDIFEVIIPGEERCITQIHAWKNDKSLLSGLGTSDFFARPVNDFIKVAVLISASTSQIKIVIINPNVEFEENISVLPF